MSPNLPAPAAWPAAPPTGAVVIAHPAWEAARNFVLDRASEGPVTIVLIGPPGSGKTWLLRELAASLGEHGFPTMMSLRGDLPYMLMDDAAVLIDEASNLPDQGLNELLAQDRAVVVLADVEPFGDVAGLRPTASVVVALRNLSNREVSGFAAEWLRQTGLSPAALPPAALARLVLHGQGTVRLIVQLLGAGVAASRASGRVTLTPADIDQAAEKLNGGNAPGPVAAPAQSPKQASAPMTPATRRTAVQRAIPP